MGAREPRHGRGVQRYDPQGHPDCDGKVVRRASWGPWLAGTQVLLLVVGVYGPAGAESPLAPLLKPLDLVAYRPDTPPPPFSGHTLDARPLSLAALRGKVLLLNFWASWCLECRPEMPVLDRLH